MQAAMAFVPILTLLIAGCASNTAETRPFFQKEYRVEEHGRKTLFDRIVELDPGTFHVEIARDYKTAAPGRIAVMPFTDVGSANFVLDEVPLTFRSKQERLNWAWTDAQRLRRALQGYLSEREFDTVNLNGIDAVLKSRGIDTATKLDTLPPQDLGEWFGSDAVVYGTVEDYKAYYFGLIAAWRVGVKIKMVSTHTGETLVEAAGSRYDTNLLIALTPEDMMISSAENILQLRDINLARSEEETCREIVRRIPISEQLEIRQAKAALEFASDPTTEFASDMIGSSR